MLQNNTHMNRLNIKNNPIRRIDNNILALLKKSVSIDISCEYIEEFDSSYLSNNIEIDPSMQVSVSGSGSYLSHNCFETVKYFNISGNQRRNTPEIIKNLGSPIETLDVSSNFMRKLTAETFKKFINLKYLNLRNTNLTTVDSNTFLPLLKNIGKLEVLILNDNPIERLDTNIFTPMMNSVDVQASCQYVVEIDTSCIGNSLKIELNSKDEIVFTVTNRKLQLTCTKERFKYLVYLNISGNQLQNVPQIIEWLGVPIKTMDLSSNVVGKLFSQTFARFDNLKYLNLSETNLTNFGFRTFYHQRNLKVLDLSFNRLKNLNFTLLYRNFQQLTTLRLEGNELKELNSVNREIFPSLREFGISKNIFTCDYLAIFLPQWHSSYVHFITYPTNETNIIGIDCFHEGEDLRTSTVQAATITTSKEKSTTVAQSQDNINPKSKFEDTKKTLIQRTTESNKFTTSDDSINQTTETKIKPATRFDCSFLPSIMNSETQQVHCENFEEIDTSCMGSSLRINLTNNDEIIFHSSQNISELRCTKENFQKIKYLNIIDFKTLLN